MARMATLSRVFAVLLATLCLPVSVPAQEWPSRPIKVVTPLAPGGAADVLVRAIGEELTRNLKQPIVIENRPGGGGSLAAIAVQRAAPDGYTLLLGSPQTNFIAPLLNKNVTYDAVADFTPITVAGELPVCLLVGKGMPPVKDLKEFVAYVKAHPGQLSYGSSGTHTTHHLAGEYFKSFVGLDMTHIPYRGGSPAMTDLLAGQIPVLFATLSTTLQYIDGQGIKVLGMIEASRSPMRPEIPTIGETVPGFEMPMTWLGFLGPAGISQQLTQKMHAEFVKAISAPSVRKTLETSGFEVRTSKSPQEFAGVLKNGLEAYRKIVRDAHLEAD
jgi:tripartite-type tricarboxylate transporter receptor subunit TctC